MMKPLTLAWMSAVLLGSVPLLAHAAPSNDGRAIFSANCGACHGADGRGGERAPSIATRREVVSRSDADLIRVVENGLAGNGMPAFGYLGADKVKSVVQYLRTLQGFGAKQTSKGDPDRGKALFNGKAACSRCHMIDGQGGFIAEDLSGFGQGRSIDELRAAIVDPRRDPGGQVGSVAIFGKGGNAIVEGIVRAQDNFRVTIQSMDGSFHSVLRENIGRVEPSSQGSMPEDYGVRLTSEGIDDLVSYLLKAGSGQPIQKRDDDDN